LFGRNISDANDHNIITFWHFPSSQISDFFKAKVALYPEMNTELNLFFLKLATTHFMQGGIHKDLPNKSFTTNQWSIAAIAVLDFRPFGQNVASGTQTGQYRLIPAQNAADEFLRE
jgi:hypothetical protein